MIALIAALVVAIIAALAVAARRSRQRSAEVEAALLDAVAQRLRGALEVTAENLSSPGGSYRLPRPRLLSTARRHGDIEAVAEAACALLEQPLRPLSGPLSLKIHGTRVSLHLLSPLALELLASEPKLARRSVKELGLTATYRIDGRADGCVSEDHLREQAIDTTDLHGIALAVLRQKFDEALVARLLDGRRQVVESNDGSAAALLLVLADFLPAGVRITASLEGPDRLALALYAKNSAPAGSANLSLIINDRGREVL